MEIIKKEINDSLIQIEIGEKYNENTQDISGAVELDIENQSYFVDIINSIFTEGKSRVIVNLAHVSYIDSSGLWALFEGHKKATLQDGEMVLLKPNKDVTRVLDITKLSSKMKVFSDENDAINNFSSSS